MAGNQKKWEVIKREAVREFFNLSGGNGNIISGPEGDAAFLAIVEQCNRMGGEQAMQPATKILDEWRDYGCRLIDKWDIRMVGKLVELFPSCVPAYWKGRKLRAEMADNENCDWIVFVEGM